MKSFLSLIFYICLILGVTPMLHAQAARQETALTNAAVVKLARAGFKEKTIISIINSRIPQFDLSADRMIELKRSGVTEKIIVAMLARQEGLDANFDIWSDDLPPDNSVGSRGNSTDNPTGKNNPADGSTDIFGSSGGVKGKSRSRGATGSVDQDTQTVGSATVRILRPPSEAGAPAKLEKTPTLTNDSIAELVEAGFSEGTIIRRIEQSPVGFDLTPSKLDDLRKRRVSDKIVTAMKAAMGDDSTN